MGRKVTIIDTLLAVFVGAVLAAALIPTALQQLAAGNTSGLSAPIIGLYGLIGLATVVVVVVVLFGLI